MSDDQSPITPTGNPQLDAFHRAAHEEGLRLQRVEHDRLNHRAPQGPPPPRSWMIPPATTEPPPDLAEQMAAMARQAPAPPADTFAAPGIAVVGGPPPPPQWARPIARAVPGRAAVARLRALGVPEETLRRFGVTDEEPRK